MEHIINSTALFLGSFDPIHLGHIKVLEHLIPRFLKVYLVPAFKNPWKINQTDYNIRIKMCEAALKDYGLTDKVDIYLGNISPDSSGGYYTYKQIEDLAGRNYYIVGGTDIKNKIGAWKNSDWILENFNFYSIPRPGYKNETENPDLIEISSSRIRNLIIKDKSTENLISPGVIEIINEEKLYVV